MKDFIEKASNLEELSLFLTRLNNQKCSHIGYCGDEAKEIYHTLKDDFTGDNGDVRFLVARSNTGEIEAAIGVDIDGDTAEVWGPFNQTSSIQLQHLLWEKLLQENPKLNVFHFFINKENVQQQIFMAEIKAEVTGEHLLLELKKEDFEKVTKMESTLLKESDFLSFKKLHNQIFPSTYYNADVIKERLSAVNSLRVLKKEGKEIQAYTYFEVNPDIAEASLEYVGVAKGCRNSGLGTKMLKEAVTEMFSFPTIKEIKLVVQYSNGPANHIYFKTGFKQQDRLISYVLKRRGITRN